ncbi:MULTISPECIES: LPXTG cell wall anchor domain-containing protein [unclassified Crossiella]|uniref:LPXTG cell wall anchor domain-containing protein n=1 Tax=unclassified Crossiella TaxID=2620835 RepID=UPI001FFE46C1|nr:MULTISPECIES: LPXTG cell wall anchor domain-containing protein [unclassified Crossiella]MCK2245085.1 LPXTG cell wall anchor domain-containing protein [Crossiella sp. S99.2]MCK2258666.1 LPXTG cell wall anchor domain-containing protein [Crossiella sp. S99.1]
MTALHRLIVVLAVLAGTTIGAPPAFAAGTPGYCPDDTGVTVIIDFQQLGGSTIIRCAPGKQASGHAALRAAGINITGTARWGEAFVCRIEGKPGSDTEPCMDTPPASAYWSYWHAPNGGGWTYSQLGVLNRTPPPGSFEGWSFSKDRTAESNPAPRIAPKRPNPQQPPRTNQPPPGNPPPPGGNPPPGGQPPPGANPPPSSETPPPSGEPTSATTPPSTSDTPTSSSAPPSTSEGLAWTGGVEAEKPKPEQGFPLSTALGIGAVAVLVLGAGLLAWRRRRNADNPS